MSALTTLAVAIALSASDPAPVAVIEMFTSQGCSSCPSADTQLRKLHRGGEVSGVEVIPLSFHVDYWNSIGWRDPYSKSRWSRRQERYAKTLPSGVYTPQAVVNGQAHEVGSRVGALERLIGRNAYRGPRNLSGSVRRRGDQITISLAGKVVVGGDLLLFVTESGLETKVTRGENRGRILRNDAVVRSMHSLPVQSTGARFEKTLTVDLKPAWRGELAVVALWQHAKSREISDAIRVPLPGRLVAR